jgi:hypothetical protein
MLLLGTAEPHPAERVAAVEKLVALSHTHEIW